MKTILICTDFSEAATNAARYGASLAETMSARALLFHSFYPPADTDDKFPEYPQNEQEVMSKLQVLQRQLDPTGRLIVECMTRRGFSAETIAAVAEDESAFLIVMGKSAETRAIEVILGDITTSLLSKSKAPLLVVPQAAKYYTPGRIAFACDYKLKASALQPLKELASALKSHILIVNLFKEKDLLDSDKAVGQLDVEYVLKDVDHSYYFLDDKDFAAGINFFADEHEIDIIATVFHEHKLFARLFTHDHIRQLSFHSHLPLLIVPELPGN